MTPRRPARSATSGASSPGPGADAAFDRTLAAAARSLATEPLPRGILEAAALPWVRTASVRLAWAVTAVAVLVGLAAVLGGLVRPTVPGRGPVLNPTVVVTNQLRGSGWSCRPGPGSSPSVGAVSSAAIPVPSGTAAHLSAEVCEAPPTLHPLVAAMIFDESAAGEPVGVHIKAGILGLSNGTLEARQIDLLYEIVALPFADAADGAAARAWVRGHLPSTAGSEPTSIAGVALRLEVLNGGGYGILIGTAAATP